MLLVLVAGGFPGTTASAAGTPPEQGEPAAAVPPTAGDRHPAGAPRIAAGECTGHDSDLTPPSEIRVLIHAEHDSDGWGVDGTEIGVRTVPFREYVQDVLPSEWPATWPGESLRAGAIAVKNYAWYWTQNWRGGEYEGECYDVDDSIAYQRYIPGNNALTSNIAITSTWNLAARKDGEIFSTGYRATLTGNTDEACGAGREDRPDLLSQWGSRACAREGRTAQEIVRMYYPGSEVR
ncbi:hypothetical protein GCM10027563_12210 [Parasphingorhabdus pacifica]